jgi:hypothetical protein
MSFSASDAAFEGFRVVRRKPMTLVFWTLLYIVVMGAVFALVGPGLAGMMTASARIEAAGAGASLADMQPLFQNFALMVAIIAPLSLLAGAVMAAAVARAVLRPNESGFGYIRVGGDEFRVLAVTIVLALLMFAVTALGSVLIGVLAAAAGRTPMLWLVVVLGGIALVCFYVWLLVRLSLAVPITMAERRIAIFDSFRLTKGRFWSLLGMALLAGVLSMVVGILGGLVGWPLEMMTGGGLKSLAGMDGQDVGTLLQNAWPGILAWVIVNAVVAALQVAVLYAPFSAAYLGLTGDKADARVFEELTAGRGPVRPASSPAPASPSRPDDRRGRRRAPCGGPRAGPAPP